jgi:hypothetical protein
MFYSRLLRRWLLFDALFIIGVAALDYLVKTKDTHFTVLYFYTMAIIPASITFGQVVASVFYFFKKNTKSGFFYLLHFVLWLVMTWLLFVVHLFLFVGAPSVGDS